MKYYFQCPHCGNDEKFVRPTEESSNLGCGLLMFGGLIGALLYAGHLRQRVQCVKCLYIFRPPPVPSAPVAKFAGWIFALLFLSIVTAVFFCFVDGLAGNLPSVPGIDLIEEVVAKQPRVIAYLLATVSILIVIACWVAAGISNIKYRKRFSQVYRVKPLSSQELEGEISSPQDH